MGRRLCRRQSKGRKGRSRWGMGYGYGMGYGGGYGMGYGVRGVRWWAWA
ncbi:MAG: hypothetical protein ACLU99_03325 [Alphaproteobacteria bacterium]